jgi:hypothetical protein
VVEVVFSCPNTRCNKLFIAYSGERNMNRPQPLLLTRPHEPIPVPFDASVQSISPSFCKIYDEAHAAEEYGLFQICGGGYRKALEFLIKDYLISTRTDVDPDVIKKTMLGLGIDRYVNDPRVKEIAARATWLGNDEVHYERRWVDKDLSDLKTLIRLTQHWIVAEHLTAEALASMPRPGGTSCPTLLV